MSDWIAAPVCNECWNAVEPNRRPARMLLVEDEICSQCGKPTRSGIYIRMHVSQVKFGETS